jgi:hypothetical protein
VILWNQHIAVIRYNGAVTEIPDDDASVVDAKQLIEVRVAWIIEHEEGLRIRCVCATRLVSQAGVMQSQPEALR